MAASSSVLSETLQSITVTKIRELERQKAAYNARKRKILSSADEESENVQERLSALLDGVKDLPDTQRTAVQSELANIRRWLAQAACDPSFPETKLLEFEQWLRGQLDQGSRKLDLAHLYSRLLTEWIESPMTNNAGPEDMEASGSDEAFEVVENRQKARLEQLRDKFARVVFEPLQTDETEIEEYLNGLFEGDHGKRTLRILREQVSNYSKWERDHNDLFDDQSLKWCIRALLKNDLLNDEKKASLNDFLKDEAVLSEICDVLNMRYRDLKDWSWNLGEEGMPVVPRQSLNGKWRVMMDEDVLQALLTHWIGTTWAVRVKQALVGTRRSRLWKQYTRLSEVELAKRKYYFEHYDFANMTGSKNVANERAKVWDRTFFLSPLPSKEFEEAGGYDDDGEDDSESDKMSPKDVKQLLLRTLATEVLMHRSLDGEVAVVQSDFQWFATGIAHSTVFAIMRFIGFEEEWIEFFRKVLEPPLNMLDGSPVRTRKRGLPMAHIFEKLLGELVLYFMDLAVAHQSQGMMLYRFHDDLWLVGKPCDVTASWKEMEKFARIMGLEFNKSKTGSVYLTDGLRRRDPDVVKVLPDGPVIMDFLVLDPASGSWVIDQDHVKEHVNQLHKQLADSKSVLQWIKTWNSCIGRFFSYTFGEPAHCFGLSHVDKILKAHRDMQKVLFNGEMGNSVTEYIKHMLTARFNMEDVPDSFIFMPESLGGLGLKNPFIPLLLLRKDICRDPEESMRKYLREERESYEDAKKEFHALSDKERRKRYRAAFDEEDDREMEAPISWKDAQTFMSFEDFVKQRELTSGSLCTLYKHFMDAPKEDGVSRTDRVRTGIQALKRPGSISSVDLDSDAALLWIVHFYEDELFDKFGGLEVVDKGLLPMGVLKALRSRKVTWQMVL